MGTCLQLTVLQLQRSFLSFCLRSATPISLNQCHYLWNRPIIQGVHLQLC